MTTFTSEDRESAYAGANVPSMDEIEARLNEVIAQYERLKAEYLQLKADSNRYIQLWLDTKPSKPLSQEQIKEIWESFIIRTPADVVRFVAAIEVAHGIGSGE